MEGEVTTQFNATPKQLELIRKLRDERQLDNDSDGFVDRKLREGMTKGFASRLIERLLAQPPKQQLPLVESRRVPLPKVEDGYYAVEDDQVLKFFRVHTPTEGRWDGFTFLDVQASDELYPVKQYDHKLKVMQAIAADPRKAAERYGQEIGSCGICGRTLTDEDSRRRGIGPVCAEAKGWRYE